MIGQTEWLAAVSRRRDLPTDAVTVARHLAGRADDGQCSTTAAGLASALRMPIAEVHSAVDALRRIGALGREHPHRLIKAARHLPEPEKPRRRGRRGGRGSKTMSRALAVAA